MVAAVDAVNEQRSAPEVAVHAARLVYGGVALFDDLDFQLEAGRTTVLLGPSGVGKTSLLRLIADLASDEERAGRDDAVRCSDGLPLAGRAAYMAQTDLLLPWLSALDNVMLGARLRGEAIAPARERATALLEAVGLAQVRHALPADLSGGMRQRVALARTLMEDRPVVLMDEPFSALDAITRHRLQGLSADLLRGRTVLLITHDPLEALRLGDAVYVMAGRPARLSPAEVPPGAPARSVSDAAVLRLQGVLLAERSRAAETTDAA